MSKIITAPIAGLLILGVVGYAATAQTGRNASAPPQMPTINQSAGDATDNSRECQPGVVDDACVYL